MYLIPHAFRQLAGLFLVAVLAGCASTPHIKNTQITEMKPVGRDQLTSGREQQRSTDLALFVAFSGGGTRAAAFSYGVLEELRDTRYRVNGEESRLLDQIDGITSVSGGSFTAAYYGLFGDQIFEDYEDVFLYYLGEAPVDTGFSPVKGRVVGETSNPWAVAFDVAWHW